VLVDDGWIGSLAYEYAQAHILLLEERIQQRKRHTVFDMSSYHIAYSRTPKDLRTYIKRCGQNEREFFQCAQKKQRDYPHALPKDADASTPAPEDRYWATESRLDFITVITSPSDKDESEASPRNLSNSGQVDIEAHPSISTQTRNETIGEEKLSTVEHYDIDDQGLRKPAIRDVEENEVKAALQPAFVALFSQRTSFFQFIMTVHHISHLLRQADPDQHQSEIDLLVNGAIQKADEALTMSSRHESIIIKMMLVIIAVRSWPWPILDT
jgi:hypothetical protein